MKDVMAVAIGGLWVGGVGLVALTALLMQTGMDSILSLFAASLIVGAPAAFVTSAAVYGAAHSSKKKPQQS